MKFIDGIWSILGYFYVGGFDGRWIRNVGDDVS